MKSVPHTHRTCATLALLAALAGAVVAEWQGCESSDDCAQTVPGKTSCCHVGDRRCLTMDSCAWANKVDKTNRNCDCIAPGVKGRHVARWGACRLSSDCDTGLVRGQQLHCHRGDRRCLTDADCAWANLVDRTGRDCSQPTDYHCYNGKLEHELGETSYYFGDFECGGECPKCHNIDPCNVDSDCECGNCQQDLDPSIHYCWPKHPTVP
eukprot:m51a1_g4979 hypothetical protein (209) ;mRNA; f:32188-32814